MVRLSHLAWTVGCPAPGTLAGLDVVLSSVSGLEMDIRSSASLYEETGRDLIFGFGFWYWGGPAEGRADRSIGMGSPLTLRSLPLLPRAYWVGTALGSGFPAVLTVLQNRYRTGAIVQLVFLKLASENGTPDH